MCIVYSLAFHNVRCTFHVVVHLSQLPETDWKQNGRQPCLSATVCVIKTLKAKNRGGVNSYHDEYYNSPFISIAHEIKNDSNWTTWKWDQLKITVYCHYSNIFQIRQLIIYTHALIQWLCSWKKSILHIFYFDLNSICQYVQLTVEWKLSQL